MDKQTRKVRLTLAQKNANDFQWFKDRANNIRGLAFTNATYNNQISEYKRKKVNYDLFNGIIDVRDFEHVCKPFGAEAGELPATFSNKDIVSTRIKKVLGMEMKRPFSWTITAVNEEATTRKEEHQFGLIREYVVSSIMTPIQQEIEIKYQEQLQNKNLTKEEKKQIQEQIAQELETKTPPEVKKYMTREHQDPAEALAQQLMNVVVQEQQVKRKFDKGLKHGLLSGDLVYWVGQMRGKPGVTVINPIRFDYDKSPDVDFIEDGEWACAEYRMTPSQVIAMFGSELADSQINAVYNHSLRGAQIYEQDWTFNENRNKAASTLSVFHTVFKDLRRVGFLTYTDLKTGKEELTQVSENYKLRKDLGDIKIKWEWIPETYETYTLMNDVYVFMRPIEGQYKDLNDMFQCKLPYYGASFDNLNSEVTSLMDRMKVWQYYYNIIMYRLELLLASDKGKLMLMNINAIPRSAGIDIEKWLYYAEALKIGWVNPNEEGNKGLDVTNMAKEINMSLMSDIQKYVELASYIDEQCGKSVGLNDSMLGGISASASVGNTQQNVASNTDILEPYFDLHNHVKRNVLQALIEQCKISYSDSDSEMLAYTLDDMSQHMLKIDAGLLDSSTYGVYVTNASKAHEAVELVKQMAHAAMQNQAINLSDVIKVVRAEGIQDAEEQLEDAERRKREEVQQNQLAAIQEQGKNDQANRDWEMEKMEFERETGLMEIEAKGQFDLQKQAMLSMGFNEDKDLDKDGTPDVMEIYQKGIETDLKARKQNLDESKFEHQKEVDKEKLAIEKKKASQQNKPKN